MSFAKSSESVPLGKFGVFNHITPMIIPHLRFNDLTDPEPIPPGTDYASVFESDVPVVVQHTRLDSRQDANALLTTIAFSE